MESRRSFLGKGSATRFPDGAVTAAARFVRYTEQYVVVTRIATPALEAQGRRECRDLAQGRVFTAARNLRLPSAAVL